MERAFIWSATLFKYNLRESIVPAVNSASQFKPNLGQIIELLVIGNLVVYAQF